MSFFHVTTAQALRSIRKDRAIDPTYARGRREASWFVPKRLVDWAIVHVQLRHAVHISQVVVLEVELTSQEVSEHAGSGKFFRTTRTSTRLISSVCTAAGWNAALRDEDAGTTMGLVMGG